MITLDDIAGAPEQAINKRVGLNLEYINGNYPDLFQRYPEQWIAVDTGVVGQEVRAHNADIERVMRAVCR